MRILYDCHMSKLRFSFPAGMYKYTEHLMALEGCTPVRTSHMTLLQEVTEISTPLKADTWRTTLHNHPDRRFVEYIVDGLIHEFRVSFERSHPFIPAKRNLPSATKQSEIVSQYIENEITLGGSSAHSNQV